VACLALDDVMETLSARLTRESGTSFYNAFRILPEQKREAIYAFYTFCRLVDDCVDDPDGEGEAGLVRWLEEVDRCYAGRPQTPLGSELAQAVARFPIPRTVFAEIIEGCRMDLTIVRYETEEDLLIYCRRVASAVGLGCIEIFGYEDPITREYAEQLGLALQLTNIVRDVSADAARGRIYLPLSDLRRFGLTEADVLAEAKLSGPCRRPEMRALLAHEADRAEERYVRARRLLPRNERRSMLAAEIMAAVYHRVLEEVRRRGYPLAGPRVSLSRWSKIALALRTVTRVYSGMGW
jgi:phytoene synthase